MGYKEMKIIGLSYSPTQDQSTYVLVLDSLDGEYKLPVVIGAKEAEKIALTFEHREINRPSVYDTMRNLLDKFDTRISGVTIEDVLEGVYHTSMSLTNYETGVFSTMECSTGDAMVFSIMYDCPIFVEEDVLKIGGVRLSDSNIIASSGVKEEVNTKLTISDLKRMLEEAIENEAYETAAEIRDRIETMKKE